MHDTPKPFARWSAHFDGTIMSAVLALLGHIIWKTIRRLMSDARIPPALPPRINITQQYITQNITITALSEPIRCVPARGGT